MTHQCSHERVPASAHASAHASVHESAHKSWLSLCYSPIQRLPLECSRECSRGCPRKCTRSRMSPDLFSSALFLTHKMRGSEKSTLLVMSRVFDSLRRACSLEIPQYGALEISDGAKGGGNGGGVTAPQFCGFGLEFSQMFWDGGAFHVSWAVQHQSENPSCPTLRTLESQSKPVPNARRNKRASSSPQPPRGRTELCASNG